MNILEYKKIEKAMLETSDDNAYFELVEKTKVLFPDDDPIQKLKEFLVEEDSRTKVYMQMLDMQLTICVREIRKEGGLCDYQPIDDFLSDKDKELQKMDLDTLKSKHKELKRYLNLRYG